MTDLWVVVPAHNEEQRIGQTLDCLAAQRDLDFTLVVVDNASTDATAVIAAGFAAGAPMPVHVITETDKGVGCAVDTGFRHAIAHGATLLARTDADCLPRPDWVSEVRAGFDGGAELVCGHITARRDESGPLRRSAFRGMVRAAALFGRLRPANRDPAYLAPYTMHAGHNMALTADLYERCGGMPRRPSPTDRTFLNAVRRHTSRIEQRRGMVSESSLRRLAAYGVVGTARWYLDRGAGQRSEDPR